MQSLLLLSVVSFQRLEKRIVKTQNRMFTIAAGARLLQKHLKVRTPHIKSSQLKFLCIRYAMRLLPRAV